MPEADRRADRAMLHLTVEHEDGSVAAEHVIDDARPLAQATAADVEVRTPATALGCGAMDLFKELDLPAGRYRVTLVGGSERGGNVMLSLLSGALVDRVRVGCALTLSASAFATRAHGGTLPGRGRARRLPCGGTDGGRSALELRKHDPP